MYLECNLSEGHSVADKRWRDKILRIGYQGLLDAAQSAASFYAKGGPKVWAIGVMKELNKEVADTPSMLRDRGDF